VNSFYVNKTS